MKLTKKKSIRDVEAFRSAFLGFAADLSKAVGVPLSEVLPSYPVKAAPSPLADGLLSPYEVAAQLGISAKTLANWRSRGQGPEYQKIGSRVGYRPVDLRRFLKRTRFENTSQQTTRTAAQSR